jgi:hypothetical protein
MEETVQMRVEFYCPPLWKILNASRETKYLIAKSIQEITGRGSYPLALSHCVKSVNLVDRIFRKSERMGQRL